MKRSSLQSNKKSLKITGLLFAGILGFILLFPVNANSNNDKQSEVSTSQSSELAKHCGGVVVIDNLIG